MFNPIALAAFSVLMEEKGNVEFVKGSTIETFEEAGSQMLDRGFNVDEVISILSGLYAAVADEYGE